MGAPAIEGVPANATGVVVQVLEVGTNTISGPVVAYTKKPAWYISQALSAAFGEVFEPLKPSAGPVTVLKSAVHYVRKKGT
jgi:hypothetical protein